MRKIHVFVIMFISVFFVTYLSAAPKMPEPMQKLIGPWKVFFLLEEVTGKNTAVSGTVEVEKISKNEIKMNFSYIYGSDSFGIPNNDEAELTLTYNRLSKSYQFSMRSKPLVISNASLKYIKGKGFEGKAKCQTPQGEFPAEINITNNKEGGYSWDVISLDENKKILTSVHFKLETKQE